MKRILAFVYGLLTYLAFFGTFLYLIGFVGNLWVPKSIDSGTGARALPAWIGNLLLIALFGLQHSVMARPSFKEKWTKYIAKPVERSTYVLIASLLLILLFRYWQPMPAVLWNLEGGALGYLLWAVFWAGWAGVLISTYLIDHFDLFGLRQVWLYLTNREYRPVEFNVRGFYRYVRNPLMLGFIVAFWSTPRMTAGHLLFAAAMTVYILIGIYFEERNLAQFLGEPYRRYRAQTGMIFPFKKQ